LNEIGDIKKDNRDFEKRILVLEKENVDLKQRMDKIDKMEECRVYLCDDECDEDF
jgi:Tfp pilus assembly protein PilN